jgi:predicted RNA-binding Zn ribbon-like protein
VSTVYRLIGGYKSTTLLNVGQTDFLWVGNHPGLDFCNTEPVIDGHAVDLLAAPSDLRDWLVAAGAPRRATQRRPTVATLEWARTLRRALRTQLVLGSRRPTVRHDLNRVLAEVAGSPSVAPDGQVDLVAADPEDQLRLDLARLVTTATALDPVRVRCCANPACVLLFHDTSKNGRRRWHDMATCGNQAKAAAHYARTRNARHARPVPRQPTSRRPWRSERATTPGGVV